MSISHAQFTANLRKFTCLVLPVDLTRVDLEMAISAEEVGNASVRSAGLMP